MERKDYIDAFGAASLIGFSLLMAFNQVVIKVVNDGLQPVFLRAYVQPVLCCASGFGYGCAASV